MIWLKHSSPSWVVIIITRSFLVHSNQFKMSFFSHVLNPVLGIPFKSFKLESPCFWDTVSYYVSCWVRWWCRALEIRVCKSGTLWVLPGCRYFLFLEVCVAAWSTQIHNVLSPAWSHTSALPKFPAPWSLALGIYSDCRCRMAGSHMHFYCGLGGYLPRLQFGVPVYSLIPSVYPLFFVQVTARLKCLSSWKIFRFTMSPYSSNSSFFFLLLMRNLLEG